LVVVRFVLFLWLISLSVAGQEPLDSVSTFLVNDTIDFVLEIDAVDFQTDTVIMPDFIEDSEIIFISDTTDLSAIFPVQTIDLYYRHSPAKAAMMSAVLPGLGQVYNRKYWKIPIVYLAIGISVERFITYQNLYNRYRRAYVELNDNDPYTNYHRTLFSDNYTDEQISQHLNRTRETVRTWRDYAIVAVVLSYALNIVDANVDAHLMDFNIDENISLNIRPTIFNQNFFAKNLYSQQYGLVLRVSF